MARAHGIYSKVVTDGEDKQACAMGRSRAVAPGSEEYHSDLVTRRRDDGTVEHFDVTIISPFATNAPRSADEVVGAAAALARKNKIADAEKRHPGSTTSSGDRLLFTPFAIESYGASDKETVARFEILAAGAAVNVHDKAAKSRIRRDYVEAISVAVARRTGGQAYIWSKESLVVGAESLVVGVPAGVAQQG